MGFEISGQLEFIGGRYFDFRADRSARRLGDGVDVPSFGLIFAVMNNLSRLISFCRGEFGLEA